MRYHTNGLLERCWAKGLITPLLRDWPHWKSGAIPTGVEGGNRVVAIWDAVKEHVDQQERCKQDFPAFDITDIAKFCYIGKTLTGMNVTAASACLPPFEQCWMEFEMTRNIRRSLQSGWGWDWGTTDSERDGLKWGFLITQKPVVEWESILRPILGTEWGAVAEGTEDCAPTKWVLTVHEFLGRNHPIRRNGSIAVFVSEEGELATYALNCSRPDGGQPVVWWRAEDGKSYFPEVTNTLLEGVWPVLMALSFLNCKKQTTFIERKSRPRQPKPGQLRVPQITYRTLVVAAVTTVLQSIRTGGLSMRQLAMHICRGHFKNRRTGTFWWSPTVRGKVKNGEVRKNYRTDITPAS